MRRILSLDEIAYKEKKRKRLGGIVIIALLVLSSLGFALSSVGNGGNGNSNELEDGFSYNGQNWVYSFGTQRYYFKYHPDEINTSLEGLTMGLSDFAGKQIYVDSEISGGLQEIYNSLGIYTGKISE